MNQRSDHQGEHAVVIGAGVAGLLHAVPLAKQFDHVTVVDRDTFPDGPEPRRGVPQGDHVHLLVPGGVDRMQELVPGLLDALVKRGGHVFAAPQWRFHMGGGRLNVVDPSLRVTGTTRPLLEGALRDLVGGLEGVELLQGWSARELTATEDRRRVTGVGLRSEEDPDAWRTLRADLVVDTTGRGSASPRWLAELGYDPPQEQRLAVGVHYTTRLFRRRDDVLPGVGNVMVDVPPGSVRGGVALAVEDDRWLVSLVGVTGERAPTDLAGFTDFAASLWADDLHAIVDGATPLGAGAIHAFPAFSWHRYDKLDRLPGGYAVSGDAVCSFDPRFGQGMTVAAVEALELGRVLDAHGADDVGLRLLAGSRWAVQDAWDLATGANLVNPDVEGPRPLSWRVTTSYLARVLPVAHRDPVVAAALLRVIGMVDRPGALMRPAVLRRVLGRSSPEGSPRPEGSEPAAQR